MATTRQQLACYTAEQKRAVGLTHVAGDPQRATLSQAKTALKKLKKKFGSPSKAQNRAGGRD